VVTHRVVQVSAAGISTKGDANPADDAWTIRPDQVQGRTVRALPRVGYLVVYLQQPAGVASVLTAAAMILLLWGLCFPPEARSGQPEPARANQVHGPFAGVCENTHPALTPLVISPRA
jgi:signal peptidase